MAAPSVGTKDSAEGLDTLTVVSLQSRDQAIAPYRRIQLGLVLLGLFAAAVGVLGSAVLARSITAPIAKLSEGTREVAAGNFDFKLNVHRRDEIGDLAESFNQMTQGLRERADMQKFVSQSTVEMIQARTRPTSAGERRLMTMLFSDIRGFTSISEHRSPEDVVTMLNRCLSLQADLVRKFEGDVDKYVGDAVFAHFTGSDMVLNAIRCGVEIHRALDAMNASSTDDEPLAVGIGIVTGEAILGSIGSADRLDYTAIGSNVNLSARLCERAKAKEILLSESAWQQVRDLVAAEPVEPLDVKGFSEPIKAWKMTVGS
jgi:adenylate cyclase